MSLILLPDDILLHIISYLSKYKPLLNSCTALKNNPVLTPFYKNIIWPPKSSIYYNLLQTKNSWKFKIKNYFKPIRFIQNIHSFILAYRHENIDVSLFANVYRLYIYKCHNIYDVSALGKVHTLDLQCCGNIYDVSALCNVHTLTLDSLYIRDVSMLGNVRNLIIINCQYITDISALGNVHTLIVEKCHGIIRLPSFENVTKLNIFNCANLPNMWR